ncbi:MAG: 1-acyl-sn-glycerol-3-phosphate acyltransferase [Mailhella sp.]|nr:1-acyl-sn-glycerol-3-phosphate acyltransferase [Mailhella sp.]
MEHPFARNYESAELKAASFPSLRFYSRLISIFWNAAKVAKAGEYSGERWAYDSMLVGRLLEDMGIHVSIEGVENLDFEGPCVFEANHMSTLETLFLPCIIQPLRDTTFVVKRQLLGYPCLGPVLAAREPIALGRANPREDLKLVMDDGQKILGSGRSVIVFTQGTRRTNVEPGDFNSLAVKLARKAGVPVVPIALKTDAWGEGSLIKDIGPINPKLPIHVRFGAPVEIKGAREEHTAIVDFIKNSFDSWVAADGKA